MRKTALIALLFLLMAGILLACTSGASSRKEREFSKISQLDAQDLNTQIDLSLPEVGNDFKFGSPILVNLENATRDTVIFPPDYGVVLAVYDEEEGEWGTIENLTEYATTTVRHLAPVGKNSTGQITFSVLPDMQAYNQPVIIRILVVGALDQADAATAEPVGAILDVTLAP